MFKGLLVEKHDQGADQKPTFTATVTELSEDQLPDGDVMIDVAYSSFNYKDGLVTLGLGGLTKEFPHVPGIDMAGTVSASDNPNFAMGDEVILTGWRCGEIHWGGYAQKARVKADWLVKMPASMTAKDAMAAGTAGFTAMQGLVALEDQGLVKGERPVLVLGATGGVGSVAVAILANLGYKVAAVTGKAHEIDYLKSLGVNEVIMRADHEVEKPRALDRETYAGVIDAAGGHSLACALPKIAYGGSVAAIGLAAGNALNTTVVPFLLRGVNILGIDSVMAPQALRQRVWTRLASDMPKGHWDEIAEVVGLEAIPGLAKDILKGAIKGRKIVDPNV